MSRLCFGYKCEIGNMIRVSSFSHKPFSVSTSIYLLSEHFEYRMLWQAYSLNSHVFLEWLKRFKRSLGKFVPIFISIRYVYIEFI